MEIIYSRNVNDAYKKGLRRLLSNGVEEESRAGPVIVMPMPVVNVYVNPRERVLFDAAREANPFFHIVEAVWMIAGRRDATLLDRFVSDFSSRFAETTGDAHGAYGYRWRRHFGKFVTEEYETGLGMSEWQELDQIAEAGRLLRENPESRQVVMAMWDPAADLGAKKRDIPCNDIVMFRAIKNRGQDLKATYRLDMSIMARSHDAVWGAYGANFVHMTVMHEVVAALANMEIGIYRHFSNNFHVYKSILPKLGDFPEGIKTEDPYTSWTIPQRICHDRSDAETFIVESEQLCDELAGGKEFSEPENPWLRDTVIPMLRAHGAYKVKAYDHALHFVDDVASLDWRTAGRAWLQRRVDKKLEPMGAAV